MKILRYLSFEINRTCSLAAEHPKCPISNPNRYKFSASKIPINDSLIYFFWRYAKSKGFRGMVMFHYLNEPTEVLDRIHAIMDRMLAEDPHQAFQITTNDMSADVSRFDIVKKSDYELGVFHDDRILTITGEGKPYSQMPERGLCGRGKGWEIIIDYFGNWLLCCNDFQCEEAVGSINHTPWEDLYAAWKAKSALIQWSNEDEYNDLPRMCRSCLDKNPTLSHRGGV